jgi:hypothetical protein
MTHITDEDLKRLKDLLAKTTLGPWHLGLTFVYTRDAGNGQPRHIFSPDSALLTYEDCEFVVAAHELMPALLAEIVALRSHLSPAVDAPMIAGEPVVEEEVRCPHCGSLGPFTKTTCRVYSRAVVSYTCDSCYKHFQERES